MAGPLIALLGPTGAGKSEQAQILASARGWVFISTGDLLRNSPDPKVQAIIRSGRLAPSSVVQGLVQDALNEVPADSPIVMDGFPRLINEAEWLDELLQRLQRPRARVLLLVIDRAESLRRLELRDRDDDSPSALERKWDEYQDNSQPALERYRLHGQLTEIDGEGTVDEVASRIAQAL